MIRTIQKAVLVAVLALTGQGIYAADTSGRVKLNIEEQGLKQALARLAEQTGIQILQREEDSSAAGMRAPRIVGELSPREALEKLLAGTHLTFEFVNDRTVRIRGKAAGAASGAKAATAEELRLVTTGPGASRLAQNTSAASTQRTSTQNAQDSGELEVTSTRIDGINNKGIVNLGPEAPIYQNVIDRETIERLGITTPEELFRLIPQTSSPIQTIQETPRFVTSAGGLVDTPSTVSLRGFSTTQTLILVNGRELPRANRLAGPDISGIPVAAIERVEILPASASALYGSGALGGAINIVLRKNYQGQDLTADFRTSYEGGGEQWRLTYVGSKSFNEGRTTLTATADYNSRGQLTMADRNFVQRAQARYPIDTTVTINGANAYEQLILPTVVVPRATLAVVGVFGPPAADLGIPGQPGARFATVPVGTTPEQSLLLTPASFAGTAGQSPGGNKYSGMSLYNPEEGYSLDVQVEHEISSNLTAYAALNGRLTEQDYSFSQRFTAAGGALFLTANDPLNPFRNNVTPGFQGREVLVYMDPVDIPDSRNIIERSNARVTLGLRGRLTSACEWSVDASGTSSRSESDSYANTNYFDALLAEDVFGQYPGAQPAAVRRQVYSLLADHEQYPFTGSVTDYFQSLRSVDTRSKLTNGIARISGDVFQLPAGPWQVSVRAQHSKATIKSGQRIEIADQTIQALNLTQSDDPPGITFRDQNRVTRLLGVETNIPVIGRNWRPIPIESLDLTFGGARELLRSTGRISATGAGATPIDNRQSANTVIAGLKLQVVRDVALRASVSEGTFAPNWDDVSGESTQRNRTLVNVIDSARGNMPQNLQIIEYTGANTELKSEDSRSTNLGLILKPRFARGLTLTLDAWEIKTANRFATVSVNTALSRADLYGSLITRADPSPTDIQNGWLGVVTHFNARRINIGSETTDGVDLNIRYDIGAGDVGAFYLNTNASFTNSFRRQVLPTSPSVNFVGGTGPVRWRGWSSLTWTRGAMGVTLTGIYTGERSTNTTAPSESFTGASGIDGYRLPDFWLWDTQFTYETAANGAATGRAALMSGLKWTLGIQNLFNKEPSFVSDPGVGFYNQFQDPRMRYLYLTLRKSF